MSDNIDLNKTYTPSDNVVARDIEGELIIVPITAGVGDMEDELYTLNETGRVIWELLKAKRPVLDIISSLAEEYDADTDEIQTDVIGLLSELLKRKMIDERP